MSKDAIDILDEYLESEEQHKERNGRLYVSDVGGCPRAVAYDLLGKTRDVEAPDERFNRLRKFRIALMCEDLFMQALEWKGVLVAYQPEIVVDDRENWGGRADIIANYPRLRVIEHKAEFSNAYKFYEKKPSEQHIHQVGIYHHYGRASGYEFEDPPLLRYTRMPDTKFDKNAGVGRHIEAVVTAAWDKTAALMDELEAVRAALPELPGCLPRVWKMTDKVRGKNAWKTIREVPDWRCSYCPYQSTCKPDLSVRTIATLGEDGKYRLTVDDIDVIDLSRFVADERKVWNG
jgi:hypothetical protein